MNFRYYMLNKPSGYITACHDATQPTVMDLLPQEIAEGLHPVGRLDIDTCGLLLLTDDGQLDHAILQPKHHIEKTYCITGVGVLSNDTIEQLTNGVPLEQTGEVTRPARITIVRTCTVSDISEYLPPKRKERYLKNPDGAAFLAELTICEGRRHQVKRMLRAVGCRVCHLERIAIGDVQLDINLPRGGYRPLTDIEIDLIKR